MSEATQTQTLEETLNKTDFGHLLYEHRKSVFIAILAIIVGVMGWVFWNESRHSSALNNSVKVFDFQNTVWSLAKTDKLTAPELAKSFTGLDKEIQTSPIMIPLALEMGKFLYEKGSYAEAEEILSKLDGNISHPVGAFFIGLQRSVVLEKLGKLDDAVMSLENLLKNKDMFLKAKLSLELARLYIAKGEKGKAQTQLDYVISNFPNDELAKVAKLYLAQLAQ